MSPQIVVLDGYVVNPGDLSWQPLEELGALQVYDRSTTDEAITRAAHAQIVLVNKCGMTRKTMRQLPKLQYVGVTATGYDTVDVVAAKERNIVVTNIPEYSSLSVAQTVFAHLLNLTQRVGQHARAVQLGRWQAAGDWCFWDFPLIELHGLTMGIVGLGQIGRTTAALAQAFGMNVIATTRTHRDVPDGVNLVDLDTVFRQSDVLSLHCPLNEQTAGMVNAERLSLMSPTAYLINTGRGGLVDENALAEALNAGRLAGAGLDVVSLEPPVNGNVLFSAKNCFVTPHLAWATKASRSRLIDKVAENVAAFLRGEPQNVV